MELKKEIPTKPSLLSPSSPIFQINKVDNGVKHNNFVENNNNNNNTECAFNEEDTIQKNLTRVKDELECIIGSQQEEIFHLKKCIREIKEDYDFFFFKMSAFFQKNSNKYMEDCKIIEKDEKKGFLNNTNEFICKQTIQQNMFLFVHVCDSESFKSNIMEIPKLDFEYHINECYLHNANYEIIKFSSYITKRKFYDLFYKKFQIYLYDVSALHDIYLPSQKYIINLLKDISNNMGLLREQNFWPCIKIFDFLLKSNILEYSVGLNGLYVFLENQFNIHIPLSIMDLQEIHFVKLKELFEYLKII